MMGFLECFRDVKRSLYCLYKVPKVVGTAVIRYAIWVQGVGL